jgi:hypothetical protein
MEVTLKLTAEQVQSIAAQVTGGTAAPAAVYPRVEVIDGSKVKLAAAVNPQWTPGMGARMWYGPATQFTMPEPSNGAEGNPPQPLRSAKGFPIRYAFDGAGKVIGTPTVCYADHAFNDDDELLSYVAAVAKSAADAAERDRQSGAVWISNDPQPAPGDSTTTI